MEDTFGLIGVFQKVHAASIIVAFAIIVILYYYVNTKSIFTKSFYALLIALGMYILYKTYVRTGLFIAASGFLYILFRRQDRFKYIKLTIASSLIATVFFFVYSSDNVMQMRLSDQTVYNEEGDVGSGRLKYWYHAVDNWYSEGAESMLIGLGQEYARELMYQDVGNKIFAHNGFIQILQAEGLIGIGLYLGFFLNFFLFIRRKRQSRYYLINMSILIAYISMMMFQGGVLFYMLLYLAIYAALLDKDKISCKKIPNIYREKNFKDN